MIYNKPDYSTGVWADEGNIAYPTSEKIEQGHIVEKPFYEIMNYLQNRSDTANAYLLQNGLPDWDRLTTYPIDAHIKHNGVVYKALSQNEDSEPSPTSQIWIQAFADYEMFVAALEELRKIKSEDGYLSLYVSKQNPVMNGKAKGVGYTANSGLISTGNESVGYSFNNHTRDGVFHDGTSPVAMNDGVITGKFTNSSESMQYLTRSQVNSLIEQALSNALRYKVGDLYTTTNSQNPSTLLGYGTWERFAEGRTLVGLSDNAGSPNWVRIPNNLYGEYEVALTSNQNGRHSHKLNKNAPYSTKNDPTNGAVSYLSGDPQGTTVYNGTDSLATQEYLQESGQGAPHNNVQPSVVVNIWRRVS